MYIYIHIYIFFILNIFRLDHEPFDNSDEGCCVEMLTIVSASLFLSVLLLVYLCLCVTRRIHAFYRMLLNKTILRPTQCCLGCSA